MGCGAAAAGTSLPWEKMEEDFAIGSDLVVFNSPEELKEKITYYLEHEDERNEVAEHGYNTVQKYDNIHFAVKKIQKYLKVS